MKWSLKIARIAGIDVYIHLTFLLLLAFVAISYAVGGRGVGMALEGIAFLLALFGCVLLHEFGHALAARRFHVQTRDITLLPIGGVARLERMPEEPKQELWVALAGPLVNVALALILALALFATGGLNAFADVRLNMAQGNFLQQLLAVNLSLALFNMLPAFPMDGGRVLRALLASRMDYPRATQIAALIGQGIALLLGFFGLFNNPFLLFIALFVWIGASQESNAVQVKSVLADIPVSRAMQTEFYTLAPTDPLSRPVQLLLAGSQRDFPVAADGRVIGILSRDDLIRALAEHNENVFVSYVMQKEFQTIDSAQMLDTLAQRLQQRDQSIVPVVHNGCLIGIITMENVGEFMLIQNALRSRRDARTVQQ